MIQIPIKLQKYLRKLKTDKTNGVELTKLGEDVFYTDSEVPGHVDPTDEGKKTAILTLINDGGYVLLTYSYKNKVRDYSEIPWISQLNEGNILIFDATKPHEMRHSINSELSGNKKTRYAAMIWDVPLTYNIKQLEVEFQAAVDELNETIK